MLIETLPVKLIIWERIEKDNSTPVKANLRELTRKKD
jgi:hypothetical protein